ncbi:MAG: response regulator [Thermoanaerobaculaceae bacterium]|nr:response regulator [Thermoanaerobaculaceae bacterium]MDI9621560.1 response regulator [Acidobacteriota bacterium]
MPEADTILVVEDNEQDLELVEFLLEEAGLKVRKARDAEEARAQLAAGRPDLVLMDMQLPGTDGLTLVEELRRDPRFARIPVLALTAHAMRGDRERFIAGGCDGYIAKPINVTSFVDEVQAALARSRAEGEVRA